MSGLNKITANRAATPKKIKWASPEASVKVQLRHAAFGSSSMAVEDDKNFGVWDKAAQKLDLRERMYKRSKETWPKNHFMRKNAKAELDKARAEYDEICAKL